MSKIFTRIALTVVVSGGLAVQSQAATPLELPAHFTPSQSDYDASTVLPESDEPNWDFGNYYIRGEGDYLDVFRCFYNYNSAQDDWLILPQLATAAGGNFRVTYSAYTTAKVSYSLVWGNAPTPEAMTNIILQEDDFDTNLSKFEVDKEFSLPAGENVYVGFHVTTPLGAGYLDICDITVSAASTAFPAAPEVLIEMDGLQGTAFVTLPTLTVGNEPIPAEKVTATLVIDGQESMTYILSGKPGDEVSTDFTVASGSHTAVCTVAYEADAKEWKSQPVTKTFTATLPSDFTLELPLEFTPSAENVDWLSVLDVNQDNITWEYLDTYPDELRIGNNSRLAADDWVILPAVDVKKAGKYKLTMKARAHSRYCPESVELCVGTAATPESMTRTAIRLEDFTDMAADDGTIPVYEGEVEIAVPGKYYIGIHGFSKADMLYLYVSTVTMSKIESGSDYTYIDPETYAQLPGDMFEINVSNACADGVQFSIKPQDKMMLYTNILVDETYLTEDGLGELDFADQLIHVSNQMLAEVGSLSAAMNAEFFYIGDADITGFGGMQPGLRAFFVVMGVTYDEATNSVKAATKATQSEVFEFTDENLPVEEPWADLRSPEYISVNGQNVVRVEVAPNDAAGDYVYGKAFAPDHRDHNTDREIIDYLTETSNMFETWVYPNRLDAPLEPGEQALFAVTTLYKNSGKKSDKLNWMLVEAPEALGQPVKILASATGQSGIGQIIANGESMTGEAVYFTLDGRQVQESELTPGLYLRLTDGKVQKVIIR